MWHPTLNLGIRPAISTASSKQAPVAISVAEVTMPRWWQAAIARLTPRVNPKSSAFTINRFMGKV
jgi:hypothetical protein